MSNPSTVAGFGGVGTGRNLFPSQAIAATTETVLTIGTDAGTTQCFVTVPSATAILGAQSPMDRQANQAITSRSGREYGLPSGESNQGYNTNNLLNGRNFRVRLAGTGNAGANAAQSVIIALYQGTSTTLASDKQLATTGAALATVAGGAFSFYIDATLMWDNSTQLLIGGYSSSIAFGTAQQFTVQKAILNVPTAVTAAGLSFLASITMGNAAASTVQLTEFNIDRV